MSRPRRQASVVGAVLATVGSLLALAAPTQASTTLAAWTQVTTATAPSPRQASATASEPAGMLLFGGQNAVTSLDETWRYSSGNWTRLTSATSPSARSYAAMAYDPAHSKTVLFGGYNSGGYLNDTWVWQNNSWTKLSLPTQPSSRYQSAMAYSADLGGVVLFGGYAGGGNYLADTWLFNGTSWTQLSASVAPAGRYGHVLTSDPASAGVVLFGGNTLDPVTGYGTAGDTWVLDGNTWTKRSPLHSPAARSLATTALDQQSAQVILTGGSGPEASGSDTWTWDGSNWTQQNPPTNPSRTSPALGYDKSSGKTILFGGASSSGMRDDTWTFQPNPPGTSTAPIVGTTTFSAVYQSQVDVTVRVDPNGLPAKVWLEYSATGSSWTRQFVDDITGFSEVSRTAYVGPLTAGQTYQVRVVATNGGGETIGGQNKVTTQGGGPGSDLPPAVRVLGYHGHATSAEVDVDIDSRGLDSDVRIDFGPTNSYGQTGAARTFNGTGWIGYRISGLASNRIYHFRVRVTNANGTTTTRDAVFTTDTQRPAAALRALPDRGTTKATIPLAFTGTDALSGVANYDVRYRSARYTGGFGQYSSPRALQQLTGISATSPTMVKGSTYCFSVRAHDIAGNTGDWSAERCITRAMDDLDLNRATGWRTVSGATYYGSSATNGTRKGATLSKTGAALKRVGVLATTCSRCGTVAVQVNGVTIGKLSLTSARVKQRRMLWLRPFSYRTGTVTVKVLTSAKPVTIDGLFTSRL